MLTQFDLDQFTGTEHYYKHMTGINFTDGIKFLADQAGAYWLLDEICSEMLYNKKLKQYRKFAVWKLSVKDKKGELICEDGNGNKVFSKKISYTDFSMSEVEVFWENNVIILPNEH